MKFNELPQFSREFKKLLKKFPSLTSDFETAKQYSINTFHFENIDNHGILEIEKAKNSDSLQFFKIKKFSCRSLKGRGSNSGIRIIYALFPLKKEIFFLEIYFKADKENEDRERIERFLKENSPEKK